MKTFKFLSTVIALITALLLSQVDLSAQKGSVKLTEETVIIPTYRQDAPNPMPRFFEGHSHQGVQRRMYPYPFDDGLTPIKEDKEHPMIHVENEFIDLGISTELGGRVYYADDKSNGYNYLYHNHVIKPSLIGMLGNWISGSLAWGFPHHHGPNTVQNMGYVIEENEDGSKTVWIRSWDRLMRMEAIVGYTVYPNSSILEMTMHPKNRTALPNSFLFWTNPAVHCDTLYQVIFPPSVGYITGHGKSQMTTWPIADDVYNGFDYDGYDISMWKNTHVPSSFFSWNPTENYFGGYDYGKHAGTAWVGNRYVSPGMKYWADGNNPNGLKTNDGLTDEDGRYIELMAGFYTDNQPDYSWLQPYETKIGKMVWFPIRELDGLKYANRNGALNYFIEGGKLDYRLNTTSPHQAKAVVLKNGKPILERNISISPKEPRKLEIDLPAGTTENDLAFALLGEAGDTLLFFAPAEHPGPDYDEPEPLKGFPKPAEIKSVEELYLTGLRLDQFYNANVDPVPYYEEALRRDPGNYRVNTQMGIRAIKAYDLDAAEKYLREAVKRITMNYTRPRDGEAQYLLGLVLKIKGQYEEAYELLYRSSWSAAQHTPAYFNLAVIDCIKGEWDKALGHVDLSIATNTDNMRAIDLKAFALRKSGKKAEAADLLKCAIDTCKIDPMAFNELGKLEGAKWAALMDKVLVDNVQLYLELAWEYAEMGAWPEAVEVLDKIIAKGCTLPTLFYTQGYMYSKMGQKAKAEQLYRKASTLPSDYCFPFRLEEVFVLNAAMEANPSDAKAPYYLGDLYYETQPDKAIALWQKSVDTDASFYIPYRNLAWAYKTNKQDYKLAQDYIKKAVALNPTDARLLYEADDLADLNKATPKEKYDFLKKNWKVASTRSETVLRYATRAVENGKFQEAIDLMDKNFIIESEGATAKQKNYLDSYCILAMNSADKKQFKKAEEYIGKALEYPIGLYDRGVYARLYYLAGQIAAKKGDTAAANDYYTKAAQTTASRRGGVEQNFYSAMAQKALGNASKAETMFNEILSADRTRANAFSQFGGGTRAADQMKAEACYAKGLALMGLGRNDEALAQFKEAVSLNPGHVWGQYYQKKLGK